jgi:hypothetical protein
MAKGDNPFDPTDEGPYVPPTRMPGPPQPPVSGNPFDPAPVDYPAPATLAGNVADVLKPASNVFSVGMRDRLGGAYRWATGEAPSYGAGVEQELADTAARRERSPYLSVAGDIAGGTAQAFVPGIGAVGRNISLALGGAGTGIRPALARIAGYGVEGGALGAAQAAGQTYTGNPQDYARNAMVGGVLGSALGAPFGVSADVAPRSLAVVPNSTELKQSARDSYTATHNIPIAYDANHYGNFLDAAQQYIATPGPNRQPTNVYKSPTVFGSLDNARQDLQGNTLVTPFTIDTLRQQLTGVNEPGAGNIRNLLDAYMAHPAGQVRGTDANRAEVTRLLGDARGDYRAGKRTQTIEEANQYAADSAAVADSGLNVANTYGQKLKNLLNPRSAEGRWYTPEEKQDIRSTARRDTFANVGRAAGNLLGGGLGAYGGMLGVSGAHAAFMTGDVKPLVAGVAAPALGYAIKNASNRAMANEANALADRMAMNSPLYRERVANAPTVAGPGLSNTKEAVRNAATIELLNQARLRGGMAPYAEDRQ